MRSPMEWGKVMRNGTGRFVATPAEAVQPVRGADFWIERLAYGEPLEEAEQASLEAWLETPEGRRWAEG